jgi:hypothetical protein
VKGKPPELAGKHPVHCYVVDGYVVRTTLTMADLVAMGPEGAKAFLRRVLAASPRRERAPEAAS